MTPKAQNPARSGELLVACGSQQAASPCPHVLAQGVGPVHPVGPGVCSFIPSCNPCFLPAWDSPRPARELLHLKGHRALKWVAAGGRGGITPCWHVPVPSPPPVLARAAGGGAAGGWDGTRPARATTVPPARAITVPPARAITVPSPCHHRATSLCHHRATSPCHQPVPLPCHRSSDTALVGGETTGEPRAPIPLRGSTKQEWALPMKGRQRILASQGLVKFAFQLKAKGKNIVI